MITWWVTTVYSHHVKYPTVTWHSKKKIKGNKIQCPWQEVHFPRAAHQLPGGNPWKGGDKHGPHQNCGDQGLAYTRQSQERLLLFGFLQLLSCFYQRLRIHCQTTQHPHTQRHRMKLASRTSMHFWRPEGASVERTHTNTPRTRPTIWVRSGHIWVCSGCCPTTEEGR